MNSVTQSTHVMRLVRSVIGAPQAEPPGMVTLGQWPTKPIVAGLMPVQALVMLSIFLVSAFAIAGPAFVSPGTGHALECLAAWRESQHLPSAFVLEAKNADVALPIAI